MQLKSENLTENGGREAGRNRLIFHYGVLCMFPNICYKRMTSCQKLHVTSWVCFQSQYTSLMQNTQLYSQIDHYINEVQVYCAQLIQHKMAYKALSGLMRSRSHRQFLPVNQVIGIYYQITWPSNKLSYIRVNRVIVWLRAVLASPQKECCR